VPVNVANGYQVPNAGCGTILIGHSLKWNNLRLVNVLHVPSFDRNLFSTPRDVEKGCKMIGECENDQVREEWTHRAGGSQTRWYFSVVDQDA